MLPFSVVLLQQIQCYPIGLLRYYGNASNSLLCNSNHHVTIVMQQTHYYSTVTITLLWKCNMVRRSCYHGKRNMYHRPLGGQVRIPSYAVRWSLPCRSLLLVFHKLGRHLPFSRIGLFIWWWEVMSESMGSSVSRCLQVWMGSMSGLTYRIDW
jgi:hypothetical protein